MRSSEDARARTRRALSAVHDAPGNPMVRPARNLRAYARTTAGPKRSSERLGDQACHHLILIGASTGGTRILPEILESLPALQASVLVVQHMPKFINESYAKTLRRYWPGDVRLASEGDMIEDGVLYLAPSELHCSLLFNRCLHLEAGSKVNFVCPAIDVTMKSLLAPFDFRVTGVLLTGMGRDGAEGLLHLRQQGAFTIAQDQASCAVYGMPAEAMKLGAADEQLSPPEIADRLLRRSRLG